MSQTEPYTPRQNKAEYRIGELIRRWREMVASRNVRKRLWDYRIVYKAEIMSRIARGPDGRFGIERTTGDTPDIIEWLDFEFYDLVLFREDPHAKDDAKKATLGRCLDVSHHVFGPMRYWILAKSGKVL